MTIATTPLNAREELRVGVDVFRGRTLVHARRYYLDGGEWKPGKGLAVPADLLPWLVDAVQQALSGCVRSGDTLPEDFTNHGLPVPAEVIG